MFKEGDKDENAEPERIEQPGDEDNVRVRLDEPEPDDSADGGDKDPDKAAAAAAGDQPRRKDGTWAEKKAERGRERKAEKAWQTERAEYDRRMTRMQEDADRRFTEMRQELERVRQPGAGQAQQQDPMTAKLVDLDAQLDQELRLIEADDKRDYRRYQQLQNQKVAVIAQQQVMQFAAAQAREQRQQPQDQYAGRRPIIAAEFPWTEDTQFNDLGRRAFAYRNYLIHVEGKPDTLETDREALATIQARFGGEFGLRPPPAAPTMRTRSMYAGPPSRGAPDRRPVPREVDLGAMGQGTGLDPSRLAKAVKAAFEEN